MDEKKIIALRMERQFLSKRASMEEYLSLYRDMQPGQNVYWNGFGDPPSLTFRADFDDIAFNRERQEKRELIKGRFAGGNLGWIMSEDIALFAVLYRKPLKAPSHTQLQILELIGREGPLNIQQIKEETGLLVKEITPVLHRLQEAFLLYEDQYDGEWDRSWCRFQEMFPNAELEKYDRQEALALVLQRFSYRHVLFDCAMAKSFYKLPEKEIKEALLRLVKDSVLVETGEGYMRKEDEQLIAGYKAEPLRFVYALHRNDFLYKSFEYILKETFRPLYEHLPYDHEALQFLLIDGEFHGVTVGHFRNGPYDLNDVVVDLANAQERKTEIIKAVQDANYGAMPKRFMGTEL